jgi:effector-binding domain-containing protein
MDYEIELTRIPEQVVACLGGRSPVRELGARATRLAATLERAGLASEGPLMARFFDVGEYDPADADYEVCRAVVPDAEGRVPDRVRDLHTSLIPAHHAMVVHHRGPYGTLGEAHAALAAELDAVGYRLAGPVTEVFLEGPAEGRKSADYLTEVRYPFAR